MRIQHNIPSMNAYRNYNNNSGRLSGNLEKLSSGYRINRAGDDAAGLAISEKMRAQISGLEVAQKNAKDGISLVQTAEGALTEVQDMLNRMYSLAEQSANGTYDNSVDRKQLQKEVESLRQEINRIGDSANFNGIKLLNGEMSVVGGGSTSAEVADTLDGYISADDLSISFGDVTAGSDGNDADVSAIQDALDAALKDGVTFTATVTASSNAVSWTMDTSALGIAYTFSFTDNRDGTGTIEVTGSQGTEDIASITVSGLTATAAKEEDEGQAVNGTVTVTGGSGSGGAMILQVGDTPEKYDKLAVSIDSVKTENLGAYDVATAKAANGVDIEYKTIKDPEKSIAKIDISNQDGAAEALDVIKNAINYVSDTRGGLGAIQNRLDHTINNLSVMQENMQDAESTIRDTDVADEMMKYTKNNILVQSAQAMLAQANQIPQGVLQLLQ